MHPPWNTFFFFILLSATGMGAARGEESVNSTGLRTQREAFERERRLIPYMTYYVASGLTSRTNPESRNIFVPVPHPRENVYQIQAFPKLPLAALQSVSPQQIQILPRRVVQNPAILPPALQAGKEEAAIFSQLYSTGNQYAQQDVRPQAQPQQIRSETQPLRVIKINPVPTEQKYPPQLIKIIPLITKHPSGDSPPKSFAPHQYVYSQHKAQTPLPDPYTPNDQTYYKILASHPRNPFQGNHLYANHYPSKEGQLRLIEPSVESDKYALAKIVVSTTPSPYADVKYTVGSPLVVPHGDTGTREHFRPSTPAPEYGQQGGAGLTEGKYVAIPKVQQEVYYAQKSSGSLKQEQQDSDRSQNLPVPKLRVPLEEKIRFVATVTPVPVTNDLENAQWKPREESQKDHDVQTLNSISSLLKETNRLPQNLTPQNIDAGIKTLGLILERLKEQKKHQHKEKSRPLNSSTTESSSADSEQEYENPKKIHRFPEKSGTSTPGRPGIDYPVYSSIPQTNFDCSTQRYKGFFGDPDTKCQVWHYCDLNGGQASFLCPNGTIFSQVALTCDWWFNVKCASTSQLYVLNERLYKYILPFSPSFPEDFSGPVVDTYLEAKFKEMEAKLRRKGGKSSGNSTTTEAPEMTTEESTEESTESANEYQTPRGEVL